MGIKTPEASSRAARNRMRAVRRRGTKAEIDLREALASLGLSFEANRRPLPDLRREADILFPEEKVAVFVDGCFWHGCPIHGTQAKANAVFWKEKIERNKKRDADTNERLQQAGWVVIRVWEHVDPTVAANEIAGVIAKVKSGRLRPTVLVIE